VKFFTRDGSLVVHPTTGPMKTLIAILLFGGVLLGAATTAAAVSSPEGCTTVGPVAECSYDATRPAGITAAGVWQLTITRHGHELHLDSKGLFDTLRARNVVQPGDHVRVRTCFCVCCPFIPSVVLVGPAMNKGAI
jgi:hypothetical protein